MSKSKHKHFFYSIIIIKVWANGRGRRFKSIVLSRNLLCDPMDPTRLFCPWDSPGENTGELLCPPPGDLLDPEIKLHLHWEADSLPLNHLGSPKGPFEATM